VTDIAFDRPTGAFRLGDVFGRCFLVVRRRCLPLFLVAAAFQSPLLLLPIILGLATGEGRGVAATEFYTAIPFAGFFIPRILQYITQAVLFTGVYREMCGERIGLGESMRRGLVSLPALLLAVPITWIAISLAAAAFLIPGVIVFTITAVTVQACVIEQIGPFAAIERSAALTSGHRWQVLGLYLIQLLIALFANFPFVLILFNILPVIVLGYVEFALRTATLTFFVILDAAIYHGLRAAKEGPATEKIAAVFD
jgi:hypothetical protein